MTRLSSSRRNRTRQSPTRSRHSPGRPWSGRTSPAGRVAIASRRRSRSWRGSRFRVFTTAGRTVIRHGRALSPGAPCGPAREACLVPWVLHGQRPAPPRWLARRPRGPSATAPPQAPRQRAEARPPQLLRTPRAAHRRDGAARLWSRG